MEIIIIGFGILGMSLLLGMIVLEKVLRYLDKKGIIDIQKIIKDINFESILVKWEEEKRQWNYID